MRPAVWAGKSDLKRRLPFDASKSIISGDTIASYEAKIFNAAGDDLSATMIAGSSKTDTIVYVWVQAEVAGSYFLSIKITTVLGEIIPDDLIIIIR